MKKKLLFITIFVSTLLLIGGFFLWKYWHTYQVKPKAATFKELPGWKTANTKQSLQVFQASCKVFLKQNPEKSAGSEQIPLQIKDWLPACRAALSLNSASAETAKNFFETWFTPIAFYEGKLKEGLFTGYYMPLLKGSLAKTKDYNVPIYGIPKTLITVDLGEFDPNLKKHRRLVGRVKGKQLKPFYTREEINKGAISKVAPVLIWTNSEVERQFLEIEGSGVVLLPDGSKTVLNYAGENGAPYTSIARVLIDKGVMTKDNASMQRIRRYFDEHPEQIHPVLNQNKSFVFFKVLTEEVALGAQNVPLTAGYSLAIDRKWVPMGTPIWLTTTRPHEDSGESKNFHRLMVAQDTGGAIKGPVRGDVYWGAGDKAASIAGHMKNRGYYWLLLPKHIANQL